MIRSTTSARIFAIAVVLLCLLAATVLCASAAIIGVDFAGTTPANWTSVTTEVLHSNLIDETGAATNTDVTVDFFDASVEVNQPLAPSTIPTHSNSLANLGSYNDSVSSILFSDLQPNTAYRLWVFATFTVEEDPQSYYFDITGNPSLPTFILENSGDLIINGQTGNSFSSLGDFAVEVTSSPTGTLNLSLVITGDLANRPVAGAALEPVLVPEPASFVLLAIGGFMIAGRGNKSAAL